MFQMLDRIRIRIIWNIQYNLFVCGCGLFGRASDSFMSNTELGINRQHESVKETSRGGEKSESQQMSASLEALFSVHNPLLAEEIGKPCFRQQRPKHKDRLRNTEGEKTTTFIHHVYSHGNGNENESFASSHK